MDTKKSREVRSRFPIRLSDTRRAVLEDERRFLGLRSNADVVRVLLDDLARRQAKRKPGWKRRKVAV